MSWAYRALIRPGLFARDPEDVHDRTMRLLGRVSRHRLLLAMMRAVFGAPELPVEAFGLRFPNPVGLGAGMDKSGGATPAWAAMGFGFCELGAVTRHAQPGNPPPRVFRVVPEQAIVNRMGFNNAGAEAFATALHTWRQRGLWPAHPVGINLGKSKITPLEEAAADYAFSFRTLWPLADFFVVNVSSPNTPNLRQLQDRGALDEILAALQEVNTELGQDDSSGRRGMLKPILVKVAPDLAFEALDEILELVIPRRIAGLVATNTTISRPASRNIRTMDTYAETGGLSGRPLRNRSTEVIRHLYRQTEGRLPIIGVGGILQARDAWEKITAGARLLQVYTGLVFEGPGLVAHIVRDLRRRLRRAGLNSIREAVGIEATTTG
ncbi:MAG: quinone-dependent dihydroorotate dehydrogenase [Verrucomicrobiales bacterium]|nr:quinone-dependent dihydroorotate dehydrogenase [Verrucomicrobiales bacterium]